MLSECELTVVAALGENRVIGSDGQLPWRLPGDLAHFKALTIGGVLIMGRKTWDSIGRPLPDRTTIVVTRNPDWEPEDGGEPGQVLVASGVGEAVTLACSLRRPVFVVGGGQIYAQVMDRAARMVLTWVEQAPTGDALFPQFEPEAWKPTGMQRGDGYTIVTYRRTVS